MKKEIKKHVTDVTNETIFSLSGIIRNFRKKENVKVDNVETTLYSALESMYYIYLPEEVYKPFDLISDKAIINVIIQNFGVKKNGDKRVNFTYSHLKRAIIILATTDLGKQYEASQTAKKAKLEIKKAKKHSENLQLLNCLVEDDIREQNEKRARLIAENKAKLATVKILA